MKFKVKKNSATSNAKSLKETARVAVQKAVVAAAKAQQTAPAAAKSSSISVDAVTKAANHVDWGKITHAMHGLGPVPRPFISGSAGAMPKWITHSAKTGVSQFTIPAGESRTLRICPYGNKVCAFFSDNADAISNSVIFDRTNWNFNSDTTPALVKMRWLISPSSVTNTRGYQALTDAFGDPAIDDALAELDSDDEDVIARGQMLSGGVTLRIAAPYNGQAAVRTVVYGQQADFLGANSFHVPSHPAAGADRRFTGVMVLPQIVQSGYPVDLAAAFGKTTHIQGGTSSGDMNFSIPLPQDEGWYKFGQFKDAVGWDSAAGTQSYSSFRGCFPCRSRAATLQYGFAVITNTGSVPITVYSSMHAKFAVTWPEISELNADPNRLALINESLQLTANHAKRQLKEFAGTIIRQAGDGIATAFDKVVTGISHATHLEKGTIKEGAEVAAGLAMAHHSGVISKVLNFLGPAAGAIWNFGKRGAALGVEVAEEGVAVAGTAANIGSKVIPLII